MGEYEALRESIIDGCRRRGWSKIDAENHADDHIERLRAKQPNPTDEEKANG